MRAAITRDVAFVVVSAGVLLIAAVCRSPAQTPQQPAASQMSVQMSAQESVERTIGSLVVNNAACTTQQASLQEQLRAANAQIADLKSKLAAKDPAIGGAGLPNQHP